jgi:hypothetical protein
MKALSFFLATGALGGLIAHECLLNYLAQLSEGEKRATV